MVLSTSDHTDHRQFPRKAVPVGYTEVKIRRSGRGEYDMVGHAYDISANGVRLELDQPLEPGEEVDVVISLPGQFHREVYARGILVRYLDPDDVGPVRMALNFTEMAHPEDRIAIDLYVRTGGNWKSVA